MEQAASTKVQSCSSSSSTSPCILHKPTHIVSNGTKEVPRVGDVWVPYSARSLDHFTSFFIPGIEVLFQPSIWSIVTIGVLETLAKR